MPRSIRPWAAIAARLVPALRALPTLVRKSDELLVIRLARPAAAGPPPPK